MVYVILILHNKMKQFHNISLQKWTYSIADLNSSRGVQQSSRTITKKPLIVLNLDFTYYAFRIVLEENWFALWHKSNKLSIRGKEEEQLLEYCL